MLELDARSRPFRQEAHLDLGAAGLADLPVEEEPARRLPLEDAAPVLLSRGGDLVQAPADAGLEDDVGHVLSAVGVGSDRPPRGDPVGEELEGLRRGEVDEHGLADGIGCRGAHPVSFLCLGGEAIERLVPEAVEVRADVGEPARIDAVDPLRSFLSVVDEPGVLQHAQVLRHRRSTDREPRRQRPDRERALLQRLEDLPPSPVAERVESYSVRTHLP